MNKHDWTEYPFWKYLGEVVLWGSAVVAGALTALAIDWWWTV